MGKLEKSRRSVTIATMMAVVWTLLPLTFDRNRIPIGSFTDYGNSFLDEDTPQVRKANV